MSKWAWGGAGDQVVTITPEAVAATEPKPPVKATRAKTSPLIRVLPVISLLFTAAVIVLLIYFFKHVPTGISGQQVLNRFANIATSAAILAGLGVIFGASVFYFASRNNHELHTSARVLGVVSNILATGVFGTAVFCWTRSERATSLSSPPQAGENDLLQRLHSATVVIQAHDPNINRYRSAKREGVIIATESGHTFILTVPFLDGKGNAIRPPDVWVNLSDGRTLSGRFVWAQSNPLPLAIVDVETDKSPGQVSFHPTAEAFIPGQSVFVVPNPLQGWSLQKGTILSRASQRTRLGWATIVKTNLALSPADSGSVMYDESGRLLGFMIGFDPSSGESQFLIIDSATVSVLGRGLPQEQ